MPMIEQFRKLAGHTAIYGLSLVGSTVGVMILTPLYLHRLNRAEYGMNEVLNVTASMLYLILNLGISAAFIKVYVDDCKNQEDRDLMLSSMVALGIAATVILGGLSFLLAKPISSILFQSPRYGYLIRIVLIASSLQVIMAVISQCLRAKQWAAKFVIVSLSQFVIIVGLGLYLVAVRNLGVLGIQLSSVICLLVAVGVGLFILRSNLVFRFSRRIVKMLFLVALPMSPLALAFWVLNVSDRYFLNHYRGLADAGLYAAGYKVGMVGMQALITATQFAWPPIFFANRDSTDVARLCASYAKYYVLLLVAVALGFSLFAPEILRFISRREYWTASWIVPYIALAYVFFGVQQYVGPFFVGANRGKLLSCILGGAALGNLLLNFVLVPRYGISGAVISTVMCFIVAAVISLIYAHKLLPVPYEWGNLAKLGAIAGVMYSVFHGIAQTSASSLLLKSSAFLALPALLFVARFFSQKEMEVMQSASIQVLRRVFPR